MIFGNMFSVWASYKLSLCGQLIELLTNRHRTMASSCHLPGQGVYAKRLFVKVHAVRQHSKAGAIPSWGKHTGRRMID